MDKYTHTYGISFELESLDAKGKDVTADMLRAAIINNLDRLSDKELIKECGLPYDSCLDLQIESVMADVTLHNSVELWESMQEGHFPEPESIIIDKSMPTYRVRIEDVFYGTFSVVILSYLFYQIFFGWWIA